MASKNLQSNHRASNKQLISQDNEKDSRQQRQQIRKDLAFKDIKPQIKNLIEQLINSILQQRKIYLLAQIGKINQQVKYFGQTKCSKSDVPDNQKNTSTSMQPKSIEQINHYCCQKLSKEIDQRTVCLLDELNMKAKVISMVILFQNSAVGFNLGGLCFWNYKQDMSVTVKKNLSPLIDSENQDEKYLPYTRSSVISVTAYLLQFEKRFRNPQQQ